jgi:site-specific DNA-methyltransferase (adenine-specific)
VVGARAVGKVQNDDRADWTEAWALFPGFVAYVWHGALQAATVQSSLERAGFQVRSQIVWVKSQFVISRGHYHGGHEPVYFAVKGSDDHWNERYAEEHVLAAYSVRAGKTAAWEGGRKQSTVWMIDKPQKSETGHSTQKPVECMARPMRNNSSAGQPVYEPFCGSGTTIIAGEMYGRPVLACELSPQYVDVAVSRWCKFTGRKAVRERDGFVWDGVYEEAPVEGGSGGR